MRLLLDLCISPLVLRTLREAGHDAERVGTSPAERSDEAVVERALREGRTIVTVDKDFGEILTLSRGPRLGVLRVLDLPPSRQAEYVLAAVVRYGPDLERGALVVAEPRGTRIRMPPQA